MKLATWNVNSIKARLPNVLAWLDEARPDIVL
ncbi:MAG: exodeoxyribonuclease III, partial [Proteobacteria bacterium]|nr:exodeoxyribonuclease III [Pseudomonadota bacterium]